MKRFSGHDEPWGKFVDIKVNALDILASEVKRRPKGRVILSSVCDAYQPPEKRWQLTRSCLKILTEGGFGLTILTKSKLVTRDFDILQGYPLCEVGCTLTTIDERLRFQTEPGASPTFERLKTLEEACNRGIKAWAFLGPFLPELSDTDEALEALIAAVSHIPLAFIYADKLNPRPGVWNSTAYFLKQHYPDMIPRYQKLFLDREKYRSYCKELKYRIREIAKAYNILHKLTIAF
jgi:DNA repair photolyase